MDNEVFSNEELEEMDRRHKETMEFHKDCPEAKKLYSWLSNYADCLNIGWNNDNSESNGDDWLEYLHNDKEWVEGNEKYSSMKKKWLKSRVTNMMKVGKIISILDEFCHKGKYKDNREDWSLYSDDYKGISLFVDKNKESLSQTIHMIPGYYYTISIKENNTVIKCVDENADCPYAVEKIYIKDIVKIQVYEEKRICLTSLDL